jgi:GT2 family glycosyltransferase
MTVGAVIVRWRGGDEVARCLRSLHAHGGTHLRSTVLVDSGSGDGGAERLAAEFHGVDVVALDENRSFAWACNRGVEHTSEPMLLVLNPDAELTAGALETLVEHLHHHPEAAGAVPLLIGADGRSQHAWQLRHLPGWIRLAAGLGGAPAFTGTAPSEPARVAQPAAAAWLVRRPVWQALDGFDTRYAPAWWEDVDFCARLEAGLGDPETPAREGFRLVPESRVVHMGGSSVGQLSDADFLTAYYTNLLRYAERHHERHLGAIKAGLRMSLLARGVLRPSRLAAYRTAMVSAGHSLRE